MDMIKKAQEWAEKVWKEASVSWKLRKQDLNYRKYIVRPGMKEATKRLRTVKKGIFLDIGCGDGKETRFLRKILTNHQNSGILYGFDPQPELISVAQQISDNSKPIKLIFDHGDTRRLIEKYQLWGKVDRVFSIFVLQDVPDIENFLETVSGCLKEKRGLGFFILLHPSFGEAMKKKGAIKINTFLRSNSWRWAAKYPIVEENGKIFYVPYFHRHLSDYRSLMKKYFSIAISKNLDVPKRLIRLAREKQISPFYDHPSNVYFPEINILPSVLLFIFIK